MNILCINTCFTTSDVCLCTDKGDYKAKQETALQHSVVLMKQIDSVMETSGLAPKDVDYVCVAIGPGSFTGIRIGLAVAKGFCDALNIKIIPVNTLELIAYNAKNSLQFVVIKGIADEFFVAECKNSVCGEPTLLIKADLLQKLDAQTKIASNQDLQLDNFPCEVECVERFDMKQIALDNINNAVQPVEANPLYLRLCQAELQKRKDGEK